uniref:Reverse transcriptase domain-containing protein n=1 Tax=Caenorhabditis japonica TaxID=281687 RepID=A0A8R1EV44_CAEJA
MKRGDLAKINNEVRRSLENDLDKWREVKSLEAAVKGRSLKKTKRALTLKSSPFTNLERPDGSTTYNRPEIRKLVLTHFSNLYAATTREPQSRYNHPDEPEILQHEVEHAIVTSKTNISPGPDQITMLQLKLGIESIAPHLTAALNQVLTNGRTPEDWKTVKISLLPKTTKPKKVKDYRPVALSSIVSKLFTKILTRRITAKSEDYLEESQAGFRRKIAGKVFATVDDLKAALEVAWASIDDGYLRRTVNSVKKRLRACVKARGSNFEILL